MKTRLTEYPAMKAHRTPTPIVCTVDVVLLTLKESTLQVLLLKREQAPFAGAWALPGGFVEPRDTLWQSCLRELEDETALPLSTDWTAYRSR